LLLAHLRHGNRESPGLKATAKKGKSELFLAHSLEGCDDFSGFLSGGRRRHSYDALAEDAIRLGDVS